MLKLCYKNEDKRTEEYYFDVQSQKVYKICLSAYYAKQNTRGVPCLNSKLQKEELEGEVFEKISKKDGNITNCDIKLSEHWICAKEKLIDKNPFIIAYPRVTSNLIGRAMPHGIYLYDR